MLSDDANVCMPRPSAKNHRLQCHIKIDTNHLHEGLKASMSTTFEKRSAELGRDAQFLTKSAISRLPYYLTVQFMRFDWKKSNSQKAKVLRKVRYALENCV